MWTIGHLEIGSLSHYLSDAALCISHSFQLRKSETKQILQKASKTAFACSCHIYNSRNSASWDATNPFIEHKTNCSYIFFISSVLVLLPVALPSPQPRGVNLLPRLGYLCL